MNPKQLSILALSVVLAACSPTQKGFDKLDIQDLESGPVPASTVPGLPEKEEEVLVSRENAGIVTAIYRKTVECPARMTYGSVGMMPTADVILLCFEPVDMREGTPLSACPYKLAIKFEMTGIPKSVEPKFKVVPSCQGFPGKRLGT